MKDKIFDQEAIELNYPDKKLYVDIDHTSPFRIITNLVKNAFQAIPTNRNPSIKVKVEKKDAYFIISTKDNGNGIYQDIQDKLCQLEFTTKLTGSGLGLPMVKKS